MERNGTGELGFVRSFVLLLLSDRLEMDCFFFLLSSPLLFSSLVGIGNRELGEYSLFVNKSRQMGKSVQLMWFGYPPKGRQYQTTNQINSIRGKMKSGSTGGAGCGKTKKKREKSWIVH